MIYRLLLVFILLFGSSPTLRADPVAKGLAIATEVKQRNAGWRNSSAAVKMILQSANGRQTVREIRVKRLEVEGDGDKSLTVFDTPKDVAGTAFLSFSKIIGADDQWIYMPALRRTKRISTRNKSGPFMGSEFAFEDMASFELEKFSFSYVGDEQLRGVDCFVVQRIPRDQYSGYSKQIVWYDQQHYRIQKIEFYDRKQALLKVLTATEYSHYLQKYWRAHRVTMENVQTGNSTLLLTSDIQFQTDLDAADFNRHKMSRLR